jgi:hypothetical protein
MRFQKRIDSATAAELTAGYEKVTRNHRDYISERYVFGHQLLDLCGGMGEPKFRSFIELSAVKMQWQDAQDLIADALNPEIEKKVDWSVATAFVDELVDEFEQNTNPADDCLSLNSVHDRLREKLVHVGLQQIALGRRLVDFREQMGEQSFKAALAAACPNIPWEHAEHFMNAALDSEFVRKYDSGSE